MGNKVSGHKRKPPLAPHTQNIEIQLNREKSASLVQLPADGADQQQLGRRSQLQPTLLTGRDRL